MGQLQHLKEFIHVTGILLNRRSCCQQLVTSESIYRTIHIQLPTFLKQLNGLGIGSLSRNHCCCGNATMHSFCIFVLHFAVKNAFMANLCCMQ